MAHRITKRRRRPSGWKPADLRLRTAARNGWESRDQYVECEPSLLTEIRDAVPARGSNYGPAALASGSGFYGVLLGARQLSTLRIVTFRKLDFSLRGLGALPLSEEGQRAFAGLMAKIRWDPKLSGLQAVGWFRVASGDDCSPSLTDLEIFNQFFKEPWQVGLVLPRGGQIQARFFLREADGSLRPHTGYRDVVPRDAERRILVGRGVRTSAPRAPSYPTSLTGAPRRIPRRVNWTWLAAVLLAGAVTAGSWFMMRPPEDTPVAAAKTPRAATGDAGQLAANQAEALWNKWQAELKTQQQNTPPSGSSDIPPLQNDLDTPPPSAPSLPERQTIDTPPPQLQRGAARSNQPPPRRADEQTQRPRLRKFEMPSRSVRASATNLSSRARNAELPNPPGAFEGVSQVETPASLVPGAFPPPTLPVRPSPPPTPAPKSAAAPRVAAAPASGRLIWTGRLHKNETVTFDRTGVSVGSANEILPGRPMTFTVSPGDLTKNGLVIYSARNPVGPVEEQPGPQNGWNKTVRQWAPDRAADIQVVEPPGPSNGWKRLVVRSKTSKDSVIVVDWKALPN